MMPPPAHAAPTPATRIIPADGRRLSVVGLGTWQTFDVGADATARANLGRVMERFVELGGEVIDSSPMYASAEGVVGDLARERGLRPRLFIATKVWTQGKAAGIAQMQLSLRRLGSERIELMQVHNLLDWQQHLPTLRAWKAEGRIRYLGISHYAASAHAEVEAVLRKEPLDFLQINYSLAEQESARRLLPLAAERGVAVIVNMPFGGGGLLRGLLNHPLPPWAADIGCTSWAQVLLKFVLSHPAVTCTIPGTRRREHMADNVRAGLGPMPEAGFWRDKVLPA